jgi:hypothetical protein
VVVGSLREGRGNSKPVSDESPLSY